MTRLVLVRAVEAGVHGVLWTGGGEPTLLANLPEMCCYSARLGMTNALYTNGFLLGTESELASQLLIPEARMAFVRVSVNTVTPAAIRKHWGVRDHTVVLAQLDGLAELLAARERHLSRYRLLGIRPPSIQISTIIDHKNVRIYELCARPWPKFFGVTRPCAAGRDVSLGTDNVSAIQSHGTIGCDRASDSKPRTHGCRH